MVEKLEAACRRGKTSCFTSGIDPGFANDALPITLLGACERIDSVRVMEILNYDTYDQAHGPVRHHGLREAARSHAADPDPRRPDDGLGCGGARHRGGARRRDRGDPRDAREARRRTARSRIPAGEVPAGTMAGLRFEVQGIVHGKPKIILEHVTRLRDDVAPDWPRLAEYGGYRIEIKGNPSLLCELQLQGRGRRPQHRRSGRDGAARPERDPGGVRGEAGRAVDPGPAALQRARSARLSPGGAGVRPRAGQSSVQMPSVPPLRRSEL